LRNSGRVFEFSVPPIWTRGLLRLGGAFRALTGFPHRSAISRAVLPVASRVEITTRKEQYARSFYAGDRLVAHQVTRDSLEYKNNGQTRNGDPWGVHEEYWYDALGRRVFKRSRQDSPLCTYSERCFNSFERFVWDGDQILWELRSGLSNTKNPIGSGAYTGETGTVGYVHAGGIDAPVGMIRNDSTVALHRGWRETYATATDASGNEIATDVPWPDGSWKGSGVSIDVRERHTWVGSLAMGQEHDSGLRYRRNRYYDPSSGQFTQQDPIGIAGG